MIIPLFDIDGTLLPTRNPIHVQAFTHACQAVAGVAVTLADLGHSTEGMIDPQILAELLRLRSVEEPAIRAQLPALMAEMAAYFDTHARESPAHYVPLPGVAETLQQLTAAGIPIGVLSGNVEDIGWRKLQLAGLRSCFSLGAFGNMAEQRVQLVAIARGQAHAIGIRKPALVIVGDTPRDVACAKEAGIPSVGVASSDYRADELATAGADLVLETLEAHDRLLEFLRQ